MSLKIILGDKNPELIAAWQTEFVSLPDVNIRGGNILLVKADALVSPANYFGFMDGGLDWSISDLFEWKIQTKVQKIIRERYAGELLVGAAEIIATGTEHRLMHFCPCVRYCWR
jgi:O-acetyl-ADP-ribose deacetylase (regulator of RNase III)